MSKLEWKLVQYFSEKLQKIGIKSKQKTWGFGKFPLGLFAENRAKQNTWRIMHIFSKNSKIKTIEILFFHRQY